MQGFSEEAGLTRRELFVKGIAGAVVVFSVGGVGWARRAYAVDALERELLAAVAPVTTATADSELSSLPARAREQIRLYFHGVCLDAHAFTSEVCTQAFAERLAAFDSDEAREQAMLVAFEQHVVTADAVLNRVRTIADEVGAELDRNWAECCAEIAAAWGVPLREHQAELAAGDLLASAEQLIREQLALTVGRATTAIDRPAFSEIPDRIGQAAILLLPLTPVAPKIVLPTFLVVALVHVFAPLVGWLTAPGERDLRREVSRRIALLGNEAGTEFEGELARRIADLHGWREATLRKVARGEAEATVRWL